MAVSGGGGEPPQGSAETPLAEIPGWPHLEEEGGSIHRNRTNLIPTTMAKWVSDQEDTGTMKEKQSFPLKFMRPRRGSWCRRLSQTSNGWEHGRALGPEIEEVNDSDSKAVPVVQRSEGGGAVRRREGEGPFKAAHHRGKDLDSGGKLARLQLPLLP